MKKNITLTLKELFEKAFIDGIKIFNDNKNNPEIQEIFVPTKEFDSDLLNYYKDVYNEFIYNEKNKIPSWENLFNFMISTEYLSIFFENEDKKFQYSEIKKLYPNFNHKKMLLFKDVDRFIDFYLHEYSDEYNQRFFEHLYGKWEEISLKKI